MGKKTFRWEDGAQKTEQQFNYSEDLTAQQLLDWFERMAESAQHRIDLERAAKYDKLGVDKVAAAALVGDGPQAAGGARAVSADARPHR